MYSALTLAKLPIGWPSFRLKVAGRCLTSWVLSSPLGRNSVSVKGKAMAKTLPPTSNRLPKRRGSAALAISRAPPKKTLTCFFVPLKSKEK